MSKISKGILPLLFVNKLQSKIKKKWSMNPLPLGFTPQSVEKSKT